MKKQYSPTFKAQIVLELLKEEKSIAQISSEHGVHPSQLHKRFWLLMYDDYRLIGRLYTTTLYF